jgi:hypothetical protein
VPIPVDPHLFQQFLDIAIVLHHCNTRRSNIAFG